MFHFFTVIFCFNSVIDGKRSIISGAYRWKKFPLIVILNYLKWNKGRIIFHLLQNRLPNSTYRKV